MSNFFKVTIDETYSRDVVIKAESEEEAYDIADDLAAKDKIKFGVEDFASRECAVNQISENSITGRDELYDENGPLNSSVYVYTSGVRTAGLISYLIDKYECIHNPEHCEMITNIVNRISRDDFTDTKNTRFYALLDILPNIEGKELLPFISEDEITQSIIDEYKEKPYVKD